MSQLWRLDIWDTGSLDAMPYHDYLPRTIGALGVGFRV